MHESAPKVLENTEEGSVMAIENIDPVLAENEEVRKLKEGYKYGWHDATSYDEAPTRGLSHQVLDMISDRKNEPDWMRKIRHKSLDYFDRRPMPWWAAADLSGIDFDNIYYYIKPTGMAKSWEDMPEEIRATWDKLGIPEAEKKYLGGVSAQYECLRGSTAVWTGSGAKPLKTIQAGDTVFSLDEESGALVPARVLGQQCSGEKEVFEIKVKGATIGASANHPFLTLRDARREGRVRARYAKQWLPVEELKVGDLVAVATDAPDFGESAQLSAPEGSSGFPTEASDDFCWWAGVYLGDGFIHHRGMHDSVEIAVDKTDDVLISQLQRVTADLFGIELELDTAGLRLKGRGTAALAEFVQLNGLGGTAHTKRFPDWVFGLPRSQRLSFLAGYVDSDGYVRDHQSNKDVSLTSISPSLLQDVKELSLLCGIRSSRVTTFTGRHPLDRERVMTGHRITLSGNFDQLPCRSPRRSLRLGKRSYRHRFNSAKGTVFRSHVGPMFGFARIESITPVGVELTYDIEVEGHHNFVAEGFIVHNSEVVYHSTKKELEDIGVVFTDMDSAVREYPDLVKQYFGTIIPANDNKFSALNTAVWSGGSFIWVPKGISVEVPLQAYFRINQENMGQFERTLIICEDDSNVHYVEGCSAPVYSSDSLHSAVVEIIVKDGARCRYTTIQNWSNNVYNLVTKRAVAYKNATMEWIDGNLGSKVTMKYPAVILKGDGSKAEILSVAYAGDGQHQDAGAKVTHVGKNTQSTIVSKSISKDGGRAGYRGLVRIDNGATHAKSSVRCDALILDDLSRSDTYPTNEIEEETASVGHEASVSKVGEEQLFYLQSRGIDETEAMNLIVRGFIEPVVKELPLEYAVELNRLIQLQMEGSVG